MSSLDDITKEQLIEIMSDIRAKDIINFTKILVNQVGKKKAKELIKKARWEDWYQRGKEAAKKAGSPKDLDSYLEEYFVKYMGQMPWTPPTVWQKRTKNRAVTTYTAPCIGKSLAKLGDEMIKEIGLEYCCQDVAWAQGFNPDIKLNITKTYCAGDDCCQFVIEM